jgi:signal transduction histidine kinase
MRERAKIAGGSLTIRSEPESGTTVELIVPAAQAYGTSRTGVRWLSRRLVNKR